MLLDKIIHAPLMKQLPAGVAERGVPLSSAMVQAAAGGYPARRSIVGGVQRALQSVTGSEWFGPMQPLPPIAPPGYEPRILDYPFGVNMRVQPRTEQEGVTFQQMLALADNYDILRLVIETRKDQLSKMPWQFRLKAKPGEKKNDLALRTLSDPRIQVLTDGFKRPDGVNFWQSWLRALLEDLFVIDAVTVYPRRTKGGEIWAIDLLAGETIRRLIDANGRTPRPPYKAYQQIIHGVVADDYTTDELIYAPRNVRTRKIYGYSPVEQIILTVNLGLRRQLSKLSYYTEGNIPEMLISAPESWPAEEIKKFQNYFDSLAGDLDARRRVRWVPETKNIVQVKDAILKDEMDEWLARVVCYCFSVPPTPFVKVMNRATSVQLQDAALQEGLLPLLEWTAQLFNHVISDPAYGGVDDIEFAWKDDAETDPVQKAQIQDKEIRNGSKSIDEVREENGQDPIGMGPCIITGTGPVMLKPFIDGSLTGSATIDAPQQESTSGADGSQPSNDTGKPGLIEQAKQESTSNDNSAAAPKAAPSKASYARQTTPQGLTVFGKSLEKYSDSQSRDYHRRFGEGGGESGTAVSKFQPSARMQRAMAAYVPANKAEQRAADEQEAKVSRALGIPRTKDNSAFDLRNDKVGIELKTMSVSRNGKVTMNKEAVARKVAEAKTAKIKMYTVVADRRSGATQYYIKSGVGSFRVSSMTPTTLGEIRSMVR